MFLGSTLRVRLRLYARAPGNGQPRHVAASQVHRPQRGAAVSGEPRSRRRANVSGNVLNHRLRAGEMGLPTSTSRLAGQSGMAVRFFTQSFQSFAAISRQRWKTSCLGKSHSAPVPQAASMGTLGVASPH